MESGTFLSPATLAALFSFLLVSSITPGPNNIMLAVSGVNFGLRRTLPQMLGISAGLMLIIIAIGLGLGVVFSHYPLVRRRLRSPALFTRYGWPGRSPRPAAWAAATCPIPCALARLSPFNGSILSCG